MFAIYVSPFKTGSYYQLLNVKKEIDEAIRLGEKYINNSNGNGSYAILPVKEGEPIKSHIYTK